jgi:hypothetical protein
VLSNEKYNYILNTENGEVYTQLFPGIPVEKFFLGGRLIKPQILAELIRYKIGLEQLRNTPLPQYEVGIF